jgi:hypothetical protein
MPQGLKPALLWGHLRHDPPRRIVPFQSGELFQHGAPFNAVSPSKMAGSLKTATFSEGC